MITKNKTEKVVKLSNHIHFIPRLFLLDGFKNPVDDSGDLRVFLGEMVVDHDFLVYDPLHVFRADGIVFEECVDVKHDALVHAVFRKTGMEDAAVDKNNIAGLCREAFFV